MSRKIDIIVGSGNDGFGDNSNLPTEHPQWVLDAVRRDQEEREEGEREANAHGRWRRRNAMADGDFLSGEWRRWLNSSDCPLKDGCYRMPWQNAHWADVLVCKDVTGRHNPDGSQDWFPRNANRSDLWSRQKKSNHPSFSGYGDKGNVTLHGRCPSWCPGCKGDFPGCGRKLLAEPIQISFETAVDELLEQKRIIQGLAKKRARCKGPYCASLKKMMLAAAASDDAAAKIAKDESDRLYLACYEANMNFKRAAEKYEEIFNRWEKMNIFSMGYFKTRSFYKLAPPS